MAKTTNAVRRRAQTRNEAQRLSPAEVDELLDLSNAAGETAAAQPTAERPPAAPPELVIGTIRVEVPLAQHRPEVRQFPHVEARLDPSQAATLRRLFDALDRRHARMANGRHVASAADAVRYLLDELAAAGE